MRLAVTYIAQETNTFNPAPSTLAGFESFGIYRGQEVLDKLVGVGSIGGFLEGIGEWGGEVELVPLLKAFDVAGGRLTREVLDGFTTELVDLLSAAGPVDGVAMLMHGACAAEGVDDVESHLLTAARGVVGDIPVVVGVDHHANLTLSMVDLADAIIGHRTQPHDPFDTGRLTARMLTRVVAGEVEPAMAWRNLRLLSHQEQYLTARGPMKVWFDRARELEASEGVLSVSPFPMQPWLDLDEGGWSVVVVTDRDPALAERLSEEMAELAWSMRDQFQVTTSVTPAEAVAQAAARPGLTILSDTGDSVFGGAGGDSTVLLAELLRPGGPTALVPMVDPEAARTLAEAGVGATLEITLGSARTGWFDRVTTTVTVRAVEDLVLTNLPGYFENEVRMGTSVLAEAGSVTLLVSELPGVAGNHPGLYEHFGVDPAGYGAVVLKTASNFQWYAAITTDMVRADTPGPTQSDIAGLPWSRVPRPIFPVDPVDDWR